MKAFLQDLAHVIQVAREAWADRRLLRAGHCPDGDDGGTPELPF